MKRKVVLAQQWLAIPYDCLEKVFDGQSAPDEIIISQYSRVLYEKNNYLTWQWLVKQAPEFYREFFWDTLYITVYKTNS